MNYVVLQQLDIHNPSMISRQSVFSCSKANNNPLLNNFTYAPFYFEIESFSSSSELAHKSAKPESRSSITIQNHYPSTLEWQRITLFFAMFFGIGAAIRQWAGTAGFFASWIPKLYSPIVGGLAAIAPCAFYYDNNQLIFNSINQFFGKRSNKETYEINLPDLEDVGLNQTKLSWTMVVQILFGAGHAAAFGIVFSNFPKQLDYPVLKETILLCLVISNFCFGTDKAKKIVDDMSLFFRIITCRKKNLAIHESELLFELLKQFELVISNKNFAATSDKKRKNLKATLKQAASFFEASLAIINDICGLYSQLDLIKQDESEGHISDEFPIGFVTRVASTHCQGKTWEWLSAVISNAIVLSNAIYNIAGVDGVARGLNLPVNVAFVLCFIGIFSSLGLNRLYVERLRNDLLIYYKVGNIIGAKTDENPVNPTRKCSAQFILPLNIFGYFLAMLQATSGIYFARKALAMLSFLDYLGVIGKGMVEIFCMASVGLMLTTTKVDPTTNMLKACWPKIGSLCSCVKKEATDARSMEAVYLDESMHRLLTLITRFINDKRDIFTNSTLLENPDKPLVDSLNQKISSVIDEYKYASKKELRKALCDFLLVEYQIIKETAISAEARESVSSFKSYFYQSAQRNNGCVSSRQRSVSTDQTVSLQKVG